MQKAGQFCFHQREIIYVISLSILHNPTWSLDTVRPQWQATFLCNTDMDVRCQFVIADFDLFKQ